MRISELDRLITIKTRQALPNTPSGQTNFAWVDLATVWAKRIVNSGAEGTTAQQITAQQGIQYIIRWMPDINETMTITDPDTNQTLNITSVAEMPINDKFYRHRFLTLNTKYTDAPRQHKF
jgi:SPP1 family predicted phage head-tail adaptor